MDLIGYAKKVESGIARALDSAVRPRDRAALEPLEIVHAVVARIATEALPSGRGRHTFPFNRVAVFIAAPDAATEARIAAVTTSDPTLTARVVERLRGQGCDTSDLAISVTTAAAAGADWIAPQWHVEFARVIPDAATAAADTAAAPVPAPPDGGPRITLRPIRGVTVADVLAFDQSHVAIGRCAEVQDSRHRLLRTNDVAFADAGDAVNQSVSRCHAHLERGADGYRLLDDRSGHGTSIVREGRTLAVPPGARGLRLRSGDIICLGEARLAVQIEPRR